LSFRFLHKDGSYRILEGRGNNLLHDQAVRGIVFNSRDVTEQRRLEEQLRQSQKVQAIGQLTGGVAHDFNNILTAIIGYSDLLLASMPTGSERLHVSEIRKAAMRAAGLTRQLLAFSRKQVLQPRVMSLSGTVVEMDKMLRRLLGEQIDIVYSIAADAGNVKADHGQIEQVILNLAVNARDAMAGVENPQLTICVENATLEDLYVSQRADVVPGDYVELSVSDNGSGMPPTVLSRLFEPFFTTKPQGQGTGLGLATCHGIVKQSGGHIAAYSEVGCGTTFKVYLPRVMERLDERTRENDVEFVPSGHAKILFAEDEPMLRELGTVVLEELGYTVVTAENGVEALKLFRENSGSSFDLLVTDVVMPQMGGRELAEALWQIENHLRVIFCSGYTEDAIIRSGGLDESAHFLQKPYSVAAIAQKVSEVLQLPVRRTVARTSADS
jgi:signal transduction histidine kinase/ActR/RegA family two-component response regulator